MSKMSRHNLLWFYCKTCNKVWQRTPGSLTEFSCNVCKTALVSYKSPLEMRRIEKAKKDLEELGMS